MVGGAKVFTGVSESSAVVQQFGRGCGQLFFWWFISFSHVGGEKGVGITRRRGSIGKGAGNFPGSPDVVVHAGELRIADSVVNSGSELSQPDFPVFDVNSGVEAEVGILDEGSQKFGDLSSPSVEPFYLRFRLRSRFRSVVAKCLVTM